MITAQRLRSLLLYATACLLALVLAAPTAAQNTAGKRLQAEYQFGQYILFQTTFETGTPPASVTLILQVQGEPASRSAPAAQAEDTVWEVDYDLNEHPIRAYSTLVYWFVAELENGESYETAHASLLYADNRFEWQSRSDGPFEVHWYQGDAAFAQALIDVAQLGLEKTQQLLPAKAPEKVHIYAYASARHMRETLQLAGENWVAAHTSPDLAVMVLSLPPGPEQRLEMERQIPHELMHIVVYQHVPGAYTRLPTWFSEGLASIAELYPNPDYLTMISNAQQRDTLLAMDTLCTTFPRDATGAYLAYAQATSFTRYLQRTYGSNGLESLLQAYNQGLDCQRGVESALGLTLPQLERDWLSSAFGENPLSGAVSNLGPWLAVTGAALLVPLAAPLVAALRRLRRGAQETKGTA